ncbi:hypothetical protein Hanom_Chr10g00897491 [Helianthus anomalus]
MNTTSSTDDMSVERFQQLATNLDRERKAREAVENSKSDLQVTFNRLKVLAHEAIKKHDEVLHAKDELCAHIVEVIKEKDHMGKQRDDVVKKLEKVMKVKDSSKSEIETATRMLVTGIDKVSGKVSSFKNFVGGGLPRSQKYTGLHAVAYGVIKHE